MKEELRIKEPIKLRVKHLANGNKSIYLDMYMNGKRKYEFLKLYIIPEYNKSDRVRNSEELLNYKIRATVLRSIRHLTLD